MNSFKIYCGDAINVLRGLSPNSVDCCITSPPYYGLRDYGANGQIGLEKTPYDYVERLTFVFDEVYRVLKDNGTLWLVIGDSYCGSNKAAGFDAESAGYLKQASNRGAYNKDGKLKAYTDKKMKRKDLMGIPWMVAFELRDRGWYLRQDIIWAKTNAMPEPVKDRLVKSHEYVFLFSKRAKYFFDYKSIQEPSVTPPEIRDKKTEGYAANYPRGDRFSPGARVYGSVNLLRNKRDVWICSTSHLKETHFATFPEKLIRPMVLTGCPKGGIVLDPFSGSCTTGVVCAKEARGFIGIDINPDYCLMGQKRVNSVNVLVDGSDELIKGISNMPIIMEANK